MIFVPSEKGKSHCPSEWTDWDDIEKGCEILFKTLLKIDEQI
jgi:acetylornithine deacetylase/succinyl-diaminopimelate desuccinylase-like protein